MTPSDDNLTPLLDELLALRRAVSQTLGCDQYLYAVLDEAIETRYENHLRRALNEFALAPEDIRSRVEEARANRPAALG